jgi:fermentation-respiration switch protein FrsA (DUF1100 family)
MQSVKFKNRAIAMAGNLYLPSSFDESRKYAAIIVVHPGGGVKEQAAGLYAKLLAEQGFVTLAFDSSYQGESGGVPHFLDMPMNRVDDVYSAIDYVTTLPYVDNERIGVAGICAGGGYAAKASAIDHRVKAVATASAVNTGASARKGWEGKGSIAELMATLDAISKQRTAEASGAEVAYAPYVPQVGDKNAPRDLQEAADYYLTPRAQHPNAQNKMLFNGFGAWVGFNAFDVVDTLLTQPLLVIAGDEAGSLWHSRELYAKAPGPKELFLIKGAAHMDLYDGQGAVAAVNKMVPFFKKNLAPAHASEGAKAVAAA